MASSTSCDCCRRQATPATVRVAAPDAQVDVTAPSVQSTMRAGPQSLCNRITSATVCSNTTALVSVVRFLLLTVAETPSDVSSPSVLPLLLLLLAADGDSSCFNCASADDSCVTRKADAAMLRCMTSFALGIRQAGTRWMRRE